MPRLNMEHLTEMTHAMNRVHREIQGHIKAGTLNPDVLTELRRKYWETVGPLDLPPHVKNGVEITFNVLGDCTEEDIRVFVAIVGMPEVEELDRRIKEAQEWLEEQGVPRPEGMPRSRGGE